MGIGEIFANFYGSLFITPLSDLPVYTLSKIANGMNLRFLKDDSDPVLFGMSLGAGTTFFQGNNVGEWASRLAIAAGYTALRKAQGKPVTSTLMGIATGYVPILLFGAGTHAYSNKMKK